MFHDYIESGPSLLGSNAIGKLRASFRLSPSNTTMANTIRRQVLTDVRTVGFRTEPYEKSGVIIHTNTTPLVNEMIAHRIGMIPICADPDTFDVDRYTFRIDKENATKEIVDVYASDFIVTEKDVDGTEREVGSHVFFPPDPLTGKTCLITRLRPQWNPIAANEKLVLTAKAAISTGKENSRWTPVSQCSFENTRDDDQERQENMFLQWLTNSKKIPEVALIPQERQDELRREYMSMEVQRCFRVDPATGEPNDFTFYVESVGCLPVPNIFLSALRSCEAIVTQYQDLDGNLPENVKVQSGDARFVCVDFLFQNEGHTLGNLLQQYLVDNHIDGTEEPRLTYAGYKVPHPLKPEMVLRVGLNPDLNDPEVEMDTARMAVAKVCRYLKTLFQTMAAEWAAHVGITAAVDTYIDSKNTATKNEAPNNNIWNENNEAPNNNLWNENNNE